MSGIAGIQHSTPVQAVTSFKVSPVVPFGKCIDVDALIVPRVICDLPASPISCGLSWNHLSDLVLADPGYGQPSKVDGIDVFHDIILRSGPPGTPTTTETVFG